MGRDALTTGTIFIFIMYVKYIFQAYNERKIFQQKNSPMVYSLIILGILPIIMGNLEATKIGPAVRLYFGYASSLLFFLVIINCGEDIRKSNSGDYINYIEKLLNLYFLLISLHILISISIKLIPSIEHLFKIFYTREVEALQFAIGGKYAHIERIRSFLFTPESYGEILGSFCPLIIYKLINYRNKIWFICFSMFVIGLILSVTRSGIILFITGTALSLIFYFPKKFTRIYTVATVFIIFLSLSIFFNQHIFENVLLRFNYAREAYVSSGNIIDIINRTGVFYSALELVKNNISLFGNAISLFHFHNLILTIIHERGIIGATLFLILLFIPAFRLTKSIYLNRYTNNGLNFSCLLCFSLFIINETKYEFIRASSYQQLCWGLVAIFYLVSSLAQENNNKT